MIRTLIFALLAVPLAVVAQDEQQAHRPGIDLPEGDGKLLLLAACTRCHDLKGLPAYKGYWDSGRWRTMIETMIRNGAPLNPQQATVLADYLALHFGRPPAASL